MRWKEYEVRHTSLDTAVFEQSTALPESLKKAHNQRGLTEWAETTLWAAGTMWLLPGVQQLRALRMSHLLTRFTSLQALAGFVLFGSCCCFVCWVGFCSCLVSRVLQVLGDVLISYPRVLDDRQCFTVRSARRKKNPCYCGQESYFLSTGLVSIWGFDLLSFSSR